MANQYSITVSNRADAVLKLLKENNYKTSQCISALIETLGYEATVRLVTYQRRITQLEEEDEWFTWRNLTCTSINGLLAAVVTVVTNDARMIQATWFEWSQSYFECSRSTVNRRALVASKNQLQRCKIGLVKKNDYRRMLELWARPWSSNTICSNIHNAK